MSTEKLSKKKDIKVVLKQLESDGLIGISVDCVIFGFDENELKVLLIKSDLKQFEGKWSLLGDLVHRDEDLLDGFPDFHELGCAGLGVRLQLPALGPIIGAVVVVDVAKQ